MSQICYLDGKYFDAVLGTYHNYIPEPIVIDITKDGKGTMLFPNITIDEEITYIFRITIAVEDKDKHSNLLIIEPDTDVVYRFEPAPIKDHIYHMINRLIQSHLFSKIPSFSYHVYTDNEPDAPPIGCDEGGLCVAYCIREALYILGVDDLNTNIDEFAKDIEHKYQPTVDWSQPDQIEYRRAPWGVGPRGGGWGRGRGWNGGWGGGGFATGLVGGVLLGAALGGITTYAYPYPYPVYGYPYPVVW